MTYPCLRLCLGFSQTTRTRPFRRTILHLLQRFLTDDFTFIVFCVCERVGQEDDRQRAEQFARYQELDTQLATLPTTDQQRIREEIEARLREGFNDFMIRRYATKPFDPTSALHRAEYYQYLSEFLSQEPPTAPPRTTQTHERPKP